MTSYGFRLFQVKLRRENKQKDLPFVSTSEGETWRYVDHARKLLEGNAGRRERGLPHMAPESAEDDLESAKKRPLFEVDEYSTLGEHLTFTVSLGARTGHEMAMSDPDEVDAEDIDISEHYPARSYRGVLLLPEEGTEGILALEAISRACPRHPLTRWMSAWSKAEAIPDEKGKGPAWWKLIANSLIDEDTFSKFVRDSAAETIILKRNKVTRDRKIETDELDLRVEIAREVLRDGAMEHIKGWIRSLREGRGIPSHEAASSIAALVGEELANLDFDETEVSLFNSQTGKHRKVSPSHLPDVFTYPVTEDIPPELSVLYASMRAVVQRVQPSLYAQLDWTAWPIPKE